MNLGITGHQRLEDESAWSWVKSAMVSYLATIKPPIIGVTSLAVGADQLFASVVLDHGGTLYAIIPFLDYELTLTNEQDRVDYLALLNLAYKVETLHPCDSKQESYLAAGKRVVDLTDDVLAVWDGKPATGLGGTADIVHYAVSVGKRIIHLNPITRGVSLLGN